MKKCYLTLVKTTIIGTPRLLTRVDSPKGSSTLFSSDGDGWRGFSKILLLELLGFSSGSTYSRK